MSTAYTVCTDGREMGKTVDNSVDNVKNSLQIHRFISRVFPGGSPGKMDIPMHKRVNYPQKSVDKMVTENPMKCNK